MKKTRIRNIVVTFLLLLSTIVLAGCNNTQQPGPTPGTEKPSFDASSLVAGFAEKVDTTVKLTYVTNYKVDVVREGADASGMDSFKRDVVATAVVEMDLGSDLYIKVTKTRQDKLTDETAVKTEEILYKKDGKYFYQTSSADAVEVADAAAKLAEIFETATYEQIGGLTLDALVYNALDKEYELIEQTRLDCLRKYAELDGEGNFITHDDGSIIITGEKQAEVNQEFNNFLKCKINLDCGKLNINIINELVLTPAELIEIEMFFEEE